MSDIDWVAVLRHITARNVAKWIAVCAFGAFVIISLSWFASYAWGSS